MNSAINIAIEQSGIQCALAFWLPLPPKGVSINSHAHWSKRNKAVASYRSTACVLCNAAMGEAHYKGGEKIRLHYWFFMGQTNMERQVGSESYRPKDADNALASMKSAQDGFVDAGLVAKDNARTISIGEVKLLRTAKEHKGHSGVIVLVEVEDYGNRAPALSGQGSQ